MLVWQVDFDPKLGVHRHQTTPGFGHALLAPLVVQVFKALRVSASVWKQGTDWFPIHSEQALGSFEVEHAKEIERGRYNQKNASEVRRRKATVRGDFAGYSDLFAPIIVREQVIGILITGPFALTRPTSSEILERWRWLTGHDGHPDDPEFAAYLSATLDTLVLDGSKLKSFGRLLECLTQLMAGAGPADSLANEVAALGAELEQTRSAEQVWEAVRTMVEDRSGRTWESPFRQHDLGAMGLSHRPNQVLACVFASNSRQPDPVDRALRRHAFQRATVELARKFGNAIAGRVGDHGAVFLLVASGSDLRKRQRLLDLSERVSRLARQHDLSLHFGAGVASPSAPLSSSYHAALAAAESALVQGVRFAMAEPGAGPTRQSLRLSRQQLGQLAQGDALQFPARFERYLAAVAAHSGHALEPARRHLDAGFERVTESLVERGMLDDRGFTAMWAELDRAADEARTLSDLMTAYRRAATEVAEAARHPTQARRDRNLRRAVDYIHRHYTEPLDLAKVATVAGFAPKYFSRLFAAREGSSFAKYVVGLRVERAKQLLLSSELDVARVARLCGFASGQYFASVFRAATGTAPLEWRRDPYRIAATRRGKTRSQKVPKLNGLVRRPR